jgi:leader peptidase (prepilin peptidase) / N-methyltransferase
VVELPVDRARFPWLSLRPSLVRLGAVIAGGLVVACFAVFGPGADALVASFFCAVLSAVSVIDIEHRIIPNRIVLPAAAAVLVAQTILHPSVEWALAAVGAAGFLFLAFLVYPAGMGMGDVKLALLMGAMLGTSVAVALVLAMLLAVVPGVFLLLRHGSSARGIGIPFGPFLALGSVVALFAGGVLMDAYLGTLG